MKKLLFSSLIVMSTLTCLTPPERALSPKSTITGHTDRATWVVYSPDGKTLASASDDKKYYWPYT